MPSATDHIKKYLQRGMAVIPCKRVVMEDGSVTGKPAAVKGWSTYCKRLPDIEEVEKWSAIQNVAGLGLVLGEASNLCCVDVDYTDKEMQEKVDALLPYSPCQIRGVRGNKYLYRLTDSPHQFIPPSKQREKVGSVDVLWGNSYVCIPPGIHSIVDGVKRSYEWIGTPLAQAGLEALPILEPHHIQALRDGLAGLPQDNVPDGTVETPEEKGRWQHITSKASKLMADKTGVDDAVAILVKFDRDNYANNQYFMDASKGCSSKSDVVNAYKFYVDMLGMANRDKAKEVPTLKVDEARHEGGWPEIKESKSATIPDFDTSLIPTVFYDPVMKNAEANGMEPQMLFFYFLTTLSACCGNRRLCQPYQNNRGYVEAAGLYTLLVAKSGDRKTQMSKIGRAPLLSLNEEIRKQSIQKKKEIETLNNKLKSQLIMAENEYNQDDSVENMNRVNAIKDQIKEPPELSLYEQRSTTERLYQIASHNSSGLLVEINEWGAEYETLLSKEKQNYRRFIMDGWDGTVPFKYTTKANGGAYIERLCLSVGASVQEDVLGSLIARIYTNNRENDGLTQRFLMIGSTKESEGTVDQSVRVSEELRQLYRSIYFKDNPEEPIMFTNEATAEWMAFQRAVSDEQKQSKDVVFESYLSKQVGLVVRMASLLAQIEGETVITGERYKQAEQIIGWAKQSAQRYYQIGLLKEEQTLIGMLKGRIIEDNVSVRDLYRHHSRFFGRDYSSTMDILSDLHNRHILKVYRDGKSYRVMINPNL